MRVAWTIVSESIRLPIPSGPKNEPLEFGVRLADRCQDPLPIEKERQPIDGVQPGAGEQHRESPRPQHQQPQTHGNVRCGEDQVVRDRDQACANRTRQGNSAGYRVHLVGGRDQEEDACETQVNRTLSPGKGGPSDAVGRSPKFPAPRRAAEPAQDRGTLDFLGAERAPHLRVAAAIAACFACATKLWCRSPGRHPRRVFSDGGGDEHLVLAGAARHRA